MSIATTAESSTVESVTVWWKARKGPDREGSPSDCWWYSVTWSNYRSEHEPFPTDLIEDLMTINDAVVLIAARHGVVIDPSDVVDWSPDRAARWQLEV